MQMYFALGLSTVLYTVTTLLLILGIQIQTIPYFSCTHLFESPLQYSMVATMAIYRSKWVLQDGVTWKNQDCNLGIDSETWNRHQ